MPQNIVMVTYFICVQRMSHRMQITQESSEYDLMTNSARLTKQTSSLLSEDASSL